MDQLMRVGFAKIDITPTDSVPMAGYIARTSPSAGVHDPLYARYFLLYGEEERGAVVVLDLVGIAPKWAEAIQQLAKKELNIPQAHVLVACTHTHSGPAGFDSGPWSPPDALPFMEETLERLRHGFRLAAEASTRVEVGIDEHLVPGIGSHRTIPDRAVDQTLWTLVFRREDGVLGILANFPCHSTVLGADNLLISGDLFGAASAYAEQELGPKSVVGITIGAAGDVSTRFSRREQSFAEVKRLGGCLGKALVEASRRVQFRVGLPLAFQQRSVWLPYKNFPSLDQVAQIVAQAKQELVHLKKQELKKAALRVVEARLEGAKVLEKIISRFGPVTGVEAVLLGIRVGSAILVGVPGEPFNELGWALRQKWVGNIHVAIAGLAGGDLGYFPTQEAVKGNWYEALSSPFDWQASTLVLKGLIHLVETLLQQKGC